jgi:hypothetical protein
MEAHELQSLVESLATRARLHASAAAIKPSDGETHRDLQVRRKLERAAELTRGASSLGKDKNSVALGVIARVVLENLILLLWLQISEANAKELGDTPVEELTRLMKINLESGKAEIRNAHTGKDATAEFLASDRFKSTLKRSSVAQRAKEAGVEDLYNVFYRALSLEVHGHQVDSPDISNEELSVMHMQGIGALSKATGHSGVRWLIHRDRTDNETLREILGLGTRQP